MNANDRANDIKSKLTDAETAANALPASGGAAVRAKLAALHQSLSDGLNEFGSTLGLTSQQVHDINAGGGTPKSQ